MSLFKRVTSDSDAQRAVQPSGMASKAREDPDDRLRIGPVLLDKDPLREALLRVPGKDRHLPLKDDGGRVRALLYEVDRAPRLRLAGLQRLPLRVQAPELRQEGRVDVEDPAAKARDEFRREDAHVARQANEVRLCLIENAQQLGLVLAPAREPPPVHREGTEAPPAGPLESRRLRHVGNDRHDLRVRDLALYDGLRNRLEILPSPVQQHRDSISSL